MKKIYLTFDIETIVSGISRNTNCLAGVYLSSMFIAEELRKRSLKATFFISLSSKQNKINQSEYSDFLIWLIQSLKAYENIKLEPHIHALNLPVKFSCKYDAFNKYNFEEQLELLLYAKDFFKKQDIDVCSFRPGGFQLNDSYYLSLHEAGYFNSSLLNKKETSNIDLIEDKFFETPPFLCNDGIKEYPVTSVKIRSIKRKVEILNLSPDFFTLESVKKYLLQLNYININFHSFSVFLNRLIRENHKNLIGNNLRFLFFENVVSKFLKSFSIDTINKKTVISKEFIKWIDFINENKFETFFIGE